jgi:15-cis-phytoene synthase / lycopene beta-cyclase
MASNRSRSLGYQLLIGLPWTNTVLPIAIHTIYLWVVDTIALRRGTWSIESGTKLGICLWPHLEIEEAFFFFVTNTLIVFGLVAFDNALAVLHTFTPTSQVVSDLPSPVLLINALLKPASSYDESRIVGLQEAVARLQRKSRSFYLASGTFDGQLRVQLIVLYSFCRVVDDLVDDAKTTAEAQEWISKLQHYLDLQYGDTKDKHRAVRSYVDENFPSRTRSALVLLPVELLSKDPLYELLRGFEMDLAFSESPKTFPIRNLTDLQLYGGRVAGTVAQLCNELIFALVPNDTDSRTKSSTIAAGKRMGIALQCINIARDIAVDAELGRVYIPETWLKEVNLCPEEVLDNPKGPKIEDLRGRILEVAFDLYKHARQAIEQLPPQARGPIRVAVESYMEIGRVLNEGKFPTKKGRATVPKIRRIMVAWKALSTKVVRS